MLIDTHTHIYGCEFDEDRDEVIQRAKDNGVSHIILPGVDEASIQQMKHMVKKYGDYCSCAVGLHPEEVKDNYMQQLQFVVNELQQGGYVAVGEVGIDLYWDKTFQQQQEKAFVQQVEWALDFNLPLIIHTRDSLTRTLQLLQPYKGPSLRGIFHCFTGNIAEAQAILSMDNFMLGIGGVLTFKKSILPQTLSKVPLSRIVIETDAPYMAPVPCRGKRNEPAYLQHLLPKLMEVYACDQHTLCEVIRQNTYEIFAL